MNHYDTLNVSKTASLGDIKSAYRKLASKHHPDKGGDAETFKKIQVAYDTIGNAQKREQYDAELAGVQHPHFNFTGGRNSNINQDDLSRIFSHFRGQFGGGFDPFSQFANAQARRSPMNPDVRISLTMNAVDTLTEQEKELSINIAGNAPNTVKITVPRGVQTGNVIRYPGLGVSQIANAPRSDLYVRFQVILPEQFEQSGIDLITAININCFEAIVGCEKEVSGIDGKTFLMAIPPGTQYGAKFRIPNEGLYTTNHPGRGNIIVMTQIYIPKDCSQDDIELIKKMAAIPHL